MSVLKCVRTFTQLTIYDKMIILKIKFIYLNKSRNIPRSLYFFTNIVVLFIYYNNDREVKEMYLLNKTDFKTLSNVIPSIDERTLNKCIKRYDELNRYELIDNLFYERKIINMKFKNIDINDILNMRII